MVKYPMHLIIDATATQTKEFSGIGQYTKNITRSLILAPNAPQITILLYDGDSSLDLSGVKADKIDVQRIGRRPGVIDGLFNYWLHLAPAVRKIIKDIDSPLFFSPHFLSGFPVDIVPTVVAVLDFAMPEFNYYSNRGGIFNTIRKSEFWYHMDRTQRAKAIIACSENTALDYMSYYPNYDESDVHAIMLGLDIDEVEAPDFDKAFPKDWSEKGYILYMGGGIQMNKNSENVIRAYAQYLHILNDERSISVENAPYLIIAGKIFTHLNMPESLRLRELVTELGLNSKVKFTGFYSDQHKYSILHNAIAFIHLSLFEGFGIAVAEAMSAGVPVIAHNGTSYPEVVGDTGFLVDGTDPDDAAKALFIAHTEKKLVADKVNAARKRAQQFTWENTAVETLKVLDQVGKKVYSK